MNPCSTNSPKFSEIVHSDKPPHPENFAISDIAVSKLAAACATPLSPLSQKVVKKSTHASLAYLLRACYSNSPYQLYWAQYQHYNAEYSEAENQYLSYPLAAVSPLKKHAYVRVEFACLLEIMKIGLANHPLGQLIDKKNIQKSLLKLVNDSAIEVLRLFYPTRHIIPLDSVPDQLNEKDIILIELELEQINESNFQNKILSLDTPKLKALKKFNEIHFIFLVKHPKIDCVLLWGGCWNAPKRDGDVKIRCENLSKVFDKEVFNHLNHSGTVPDRLAINHFVAEKISLPPSNTQGETILWKTTVQEITSLFLINPGFKIYREAILTWDNLLKKYNLLEWASPLLSSEVSPWISESLTLNNWAKAYQNLCEIILFAIQTFPEKFDEASFESTVIEKLKSICSLEDIQISVRLYPYAMGAIFEALKAVISEKKPIVACLSQSYYEVSELTELTQPNFYSTVEEIKDIPDVLIADIHSNNAARPLLYQNNIADWIVNKFTKDMVAKMNLILDATLNHLEDYLFQDTIKKLAVFIKEKRLEIIIVQSLSKLAQLGADNFSGGACFHLSYKKLAFIEHTHSRGYKEKSVYFSLMLQHFGQLTSAYIQTIQQNTNWMYDQLKSRFEKEQFSTQIVPNGDEQTVYIGINFSQFLGKSPISLGEVPLSAEQSQMREDIVGMIRNAILTLAKQRTLFLTGRQSFGFALSNLSCTKESIRFSIGMEDRSLLQEYADLIVDFVYCLENYFNTSTENLSDSIDQFQQEFHLLLDKHLKSIHSCLGQKQNEFITHMMYSWDILKSQKPFKIKVNFKKEIYRHDKEILITYENDRFSFQHQWTDVVVLRYPCPDVLVNGISLNQWDFSTKLRFFFLSQAQMQNWHILSLRDFYYLEGVFPSHHPSWRTSSTSYIENSKACISFFPFNLHAKQSQQNFKENEIYVEVSEAGTEPILLSKLDPSRKHTIFDKFVHWEFELKPVLNKKAVQVNFILQKPSISYLSELMRRDFSSALDFIDSLDLKKLTLSAECTHQQHDSLALFFYHIRSFGEFFFRQNELDPAIQTRIHQIKERKCKRFLIHGMLDGLWHRYCQKETIIDSKETCLIKPTIDDYIGKNENDRLDLIGKLDHWLAQNPDFTRVDPILSAIYPLGKFL